MPNRTVKSLGGPYSVLSTSVTSFAPSYLPNQRQQQAPPTRSNNPSTVSSTNKRSSTTSFSAIQNDRQNSHIGNVICSIFEDRNKRTIGLAVLETNSMRIHLHEFEDLNSFMITLSCVKRYDPTKIILPRVLGAVNPCQKALQQEIDDDLYTEIHEVPRKYYDDMIGEDIFKQSSNGFCEEISSRRCCLAALSSLVRYTEVQYELLLRSGTLSISFHPIDHCMLLNKNCIDNLELFKSRMTSSSLTLCSRFRTITSSGARILSNSLRFPLVHHKEIDSRLDVVEFLLAQPNVITIVTSFLIKLVDLENLISRFLFRSNKAKDETFFRRNIKSIILIYEKLNIIAEFSCSLKRILHDDVDRHRTDIDYQPATRTKDARSDAGRSLVLDIIAQLDTPSVNIILRAFLNSSISLEQGDRHDRSMSFAEVQQIQLLSSLKQGRNSYLDAARARFITVYQDLLAYVDALKEQYNIQLKTDFTEARGYFLRCTASEVKQLNKSEFVWIQSKGRSASFTTFQLQSLNASLKDLRTEIYGIIYEELEGLFSLTCQQSLSLYRINDAIGMLDFFVSLTQFSQSLPSACRPQFGNELKLSEAYHPLSMTNTETVVPVNVHLPTYKKGVILTGPNGSGKSTLLRTIGVIQILAQVGCFVPCDSATLQISPHLLTRLGGTDDSLNDQLSCFGNEMVTTADILSIATKDSLILLDELGQGTNPTEGTALTWAILERLQQQDVRAFLATHYSELLKLCSIYPQLKPMKMLCRITHDPENREKVKVIPQFKLEAGTTDSNIRNYGILCAQASGFKQEVIQKSIQVKAEIQNETENAQKKYQRIEKYAAKKSSTLEFGCKLAQLIETFDDVKSKLAWENLCELKRKKSMK